MRYALIIPDGAADDPGPGGNAPSPLETAALPHMRRLAGEGQIGLASHVPEGMAPGSEVACLSLMGYDPRMLSGRAILEAAALQTPVPEGGAVFRANLVSVRDGVMIDYSAGHIATPEARDLIERIEADHGQKGVTLRPGNSYRHLAVFEGMAGRLPSRAPPHDIMGQAVGLHDPEGEYAPRLLALEAASASCLAKHHAGHPVAGTGRAHSANATQLWLWGGAVPLKLEPFPARHGVTGAVIAAVDLMRGIGRLAGLETPRVRGATGYYDTNYAGKGQAALEALRRHPFVCVHIEAPDEASHNGDREAKAAALEAIDREIIGPLLAEADRAGDLRLLVCPDHPTPLAKRTHTAKPVPYARWGPGIGHNGGRLFSENEAMRISGGAALEGTRLIHEWLAP